MLQAQARAEDQAVQLHEKLEAKRAATHAEKVRLLASKFGFAFTMSKQSTWFGFVAVLSAWVASSGVFSKIAHGGCL